MKKGDRVLRQILYDVYERGVSFMSQKALARSCGISLGMVNSVVAKLENIGTVEKRPLGFRVTDPKKILLYWAGKRDLARDIAYSTYSPDPVSEIEGNMPPDAVFTGYSGYRLKLGAAPDDYDKVHVYADPDEVKRRFSPRRGYDRNLFVLKPDPHVRQLGDGKTAPLVQIYVDLWQLGGVANRFLDELDSRLERGQISALESMIRETKKGI